MSNKEDHNEMKWIAKLFKWWQQETNKMGQTLMMFRYQVMKRELNVKEDFRATCYSSFILHSILNYYFTLTTPPTQLLLLKTYNVLKLNLENHKHMI